MTFTSPFSQAISQASGLIFDCDGTLVDTMLAHQYGLEKALQRRGLVLPTEWFYQNHSITADALLQKFEAEGLGRIEDKDRVLTEHQQYFREHLHLLQEVTVVSSVAREFKGKMPLAVASNGNRANVIVTLEAIHLLDCFDEIVTREDVVHGKPAPDIYLEAARRLGVSADRCVVFEDSETGLVAARAAGSIVVDVREYYQPSWQPAGHR